MLFSIKSKILVKNKDNFHLWGLAVLLLLISFSFRFIPPLEWSLIDYSELLVNHAKPFIIQEVFPPYLLFIMCLIPLLFFILLAFSPSSKQYKNSYLCSAFILDLSLTYFLTWLTPWFFGALKH